MKLTLTLIILGINWGSLYGQYIDILGTSPEAYGYAAGYATANLAIITAIMMAIPLIVRLVNGKKLDNKFGKQLCMWNSIALFALSTIAIFADLKQYAIIGGVGALEFYFINKWAFVKDLTYTQNSNKHFYPDNTTVNYNQPAQSNNISETTTNVESQETVISPETTNQSNYEKRFCTNCGKSIDKNWKFCNYCGNKLV